jgi:hypothetical protein
MLHKGKKCFEDGILHQDTYARLEELLQHYLFLISSEMNCFCCSHPGHGLMYLLANGFLGSLGICGYLHEEIQQ